MGNPIDYWYQKYLALKAEMDEMREAWLKDRDGCFWDGVNEGKKAIQEQMMKEAVEGEVRHYATVHYVKANESQLSARLKQFQDGNKVQIIIVKEEKNGKE